MADLLNFTCIRLQADLDRYASTKRFPDSIIDGLLSVDDILACIPSLPAKYKRIAKRLVAEYENLINQDAAIIKANLRQDYGAVFNSLKTAGSDFMFPTVLARYRPSICPTKALYYDVREIVRRYNLDDERHIWLRELVTDREFNNKLCSAILEDIESIERIIKMYYFPLTRLEPNSIPLELFHARQMLNDLRTYHKFFSGLLLDWHFDE